MHAAMDYALIVRFRRITRKAAPANPRLSKQALDGSGTDAAAGTTLIASTVKSTPGEVVNATPGVGKSLVSIVINGVPAYPGSEAPLIVSVSVISGKALNKSIVTGPALAMLKTIVSAPELLLA
jgi:hypothetical protein